MKGFLDNYLYFLTGVQQEVDAGHATVNLLTRKIRLEDFLTDTEPNEYGANFFIQNAKLIAIAKNTEKVNIIRFPILI